MMKTFHANAFEIFDNCRSFVEEKIMHMLMNKKLHIGELIRKRVLELKLTNSQFANLINCHRTNVNNIYRQNTIDVAKLQKISEVLDCDFFKYYVGDPFSSEEVISKQIELSHEEVVKLANKVPVVVKVVVKGG